VDRAPVERHRDQQASPRGALGGEEVREGPVQLKPGYVDGDVDRDAAQDRARRRSSARSVSSQGNPFRPKCP
jgi:hypothetical protein